MVPRGIRGALMEGEGIGALGHFHQDRIICPFRSIVLTQLCTKTPRLHVDSMVRVQAGRLRTKLGEYYTSEGADDPILVEMPKGTYALTFHQRSPNASRNHAGAVADLQSGSAGQARSARGWLTALVALVVALTAVVAIATDRLLTRRTAEARPADASTDPPVAFRVFWKGFLTGPQEPWVIFSNAAFVGRP